MRHIGFALLAAALLAAACGDAGTGGVDLPATTAPPAVTTAPPATTPPVTDPPPATTAPRAATPELMALALRQLVTVDTTFGPDHRFATVLLQTTTDPQAGLSDPPAASRPLTDAERDAIEAAVAEVSDVQWIEDPDDWRTDDLMPIFENSAIVGVGEPRFDDDGALVPVSLWCGGLCGTWFDYRLRQVDGAWTVIGPEGPVAIS